MTVRPSSSGLRLETRYLSASPEKNKGNNASCPGTGTVPTESHQEMIPMFLLSSPTSLRRELFEVTRRERVTARLDFLQDTIGMVLTDTQKGPAQVG